MIAADQGALRERAERLARTVRARVPAATVQVTRDVTEVGGGSYPGFELVTWVLRVQAPGRSERQLEEACRASDPPVVGRVHAGALCLDPRTVLESEEALFIRVVSDALVLS
jgi:L-seryl-tRNA(Ser) seleniumtransferase